MSYALPAQPSRNLRHFLVSNKETLSLKVQGNMALTSGRLNNLVFSPSRLRVSTIYAYRGNEKTQEYGTGMVAGGVSRDPGV